MNADELRSRFAAVEPLTVGLEEELMVLDPVTSMDDQAAAPPLGQEAGPVGRQEDLLRGRAVARVRRNPDRDADRHLRVAPGGARRADVLDGGPHPLRDPERYRYDLNVGDIAEVWRRGSVIPSWLLDLTASALAKNPTLGSYSGFVEDSGEGRWTVNAAIDEAVPAEVLTAALFARFRSRKEHTFAEKILSAMRAGFGGHKEPKGPGASKPK